MSRQIHFIKELRIYSTKAVLQIQRITALSQNYADYIDAVGVEKS